MEVYPGIHQFMCKVCQKYPLHYRCVNWSPNNDPRFVSWNCQGCLPPKCLEVCSQCSTSQLPPSKRFSLPPIDPSYTNISRRVDIVRSGCSNCRRKRITCSRLHTTASKCITCLDHDLECDCKVVRAACEYCRSSKIRCYGNEDDCVTCIRFQQKCIPLERHMATMPLPDREESTPTTEIPKNAAAEGLLDVIDGMKMKRFSFGCSSCEENPMLRCDKNVNGCAQCRIKKQPCVYPSVVNPLSAPLHDPAPKFCPSCYRSYRRSKQDIDARLIGSSLCGRCKYLENKDTKPKVGDQCRTCQVLYTTCDEGETCTQCKKLGFKCQRVTAASSPLDEHIQPYEQDTTYTSRIYNRASGASNANSPAIINATFGPNKLPWTSYLEETLKDTPESSAGFNFPHPAFPTSNSGADPLPPPFPTFNNLTQVTFCRHGIVNCTPIEPCKACELSPRPFELDPATIHICKRCRYTKLKCDGEKPTCSSCKRSGRSCSYYGEKKARFDLRGEGEGEDVSVNEDKYTLFEEPEKEQAAEMKDREEAEEMTAEMEGSEVDDWCVVTSADFDEGVEGAANEDTRKKARFW